MPQPKKPRKTAPVAKKKPTGERPKMSPERAKLVDELLEKLRRARQERLGPNPTFEQQNDASFEIMSEVLCKDEEARLR